MPWNDEKSSLFLQLPRCDNLSILDHETNLFLSANKIALLLNFGKRIAELNISFWFWLVARWQWVNPFFGKIEQIAIGRFFDMEIENNIALEELRVNKFDNIGSALNLDRKREGYFVGSIFFEYICQDNLMFFNFFCNYYFIKLCWEKEPLQLLGNLTRLLWIKRTNSMWIENQSSFNEFLKTIKDDFTLW